MTKEQYFYAIIKPYRQDFIINPKEEEQKIMSHHFLYRLEEKRIAVSEYPFRVHCLASHAQGNSPIYHVTTPWNASPDLREGCSEWRENPPASRAMVGRKALGQLIGSKDQV